MGKLAKEKKVLLFDLDGTLIDPFDCITKGLQEALRVVDITVEDREELRYLIGPPIWLSLREHFKITEEGQIAEVVKKYREYFLEFGLYENKLYPGIADMLGQLKDAGHILTMATSKPRVNAIKIAELLKFDHYFDFIGGCELSGERSEKDEVIQYVLENVDPGREHKAIMIGDRMFDVIGAKKNGLHCIGVTWGFAPEGELEEHGADMIVESPEELCTALLAIS